MKDSRLYRGGASTAERERWACNAAHPVPWAHAALRMFGRPPTGARNETSLANLMASTGTNQADPYGINCLSALGLSQVGSTPSGTPPVVLLVRFRWCGLWPRTRKYNSNRPTGATRCHQGQVEMLPDAGSPTWVSASVLESSPFGDHEAARGSKIKAMAKSCFGQLSAGVELFSQPGFHHGTSIRVFGFYTVPTCGLFNTNHWRSSCNTVGSVMDGRPSRSNNAATIQPPMMYGSSGSRCARKCPATSTARQTQSLVRETVACGKGDVGRDNASVAPRRPCNSGVKGCT